MEGDWINSHNAMGLLNMEAHFCNTLKKKAKIYLFFK